jgi:glycopeptide antibiotics resistance protein
MQHILGAGTFVVDDILNNVLGGLIGYGAFILFCKIKKSYIKKGYL